MGKRLKTVSSRLNEEETVYMEEIMEYLRGDLYPMEVRESDVIRIAVHKLYKELKPGIDEMKKR